ncbi:MAG: phosphatidylinositol-specific phospholipase C domain-containing protein [Parachlamydiales bacterium]|jgi:hypothetical protein
MSSIINCFFPSCCRSFCSKEDEINEQNATQFNMSDALARKKISEVFIAFSHNTYINGELQILTFSSVEEVARVILEGVRGIELDILDSQDDSTPMVSHGAEWNNLNFRVSSPVKFEDFIKSVSKYGWKYSDLPLFLCLELNAKQEETKNKIAAILEQYLKDRFIISSTQLGQLTLGELRNKVVILSGGGYNSTLRRLIDYVHDQNFRSLGFDSLETEDDLISFNQRSFTRVYPNNIVLGKNSDPRSAWAKGCSAVAMNYNYADPNLDIYRKFFKDFPIVEKTALQSKLKKI